MATVDLIMPKMGESIMEATILRWYKKVGDHIQQDETLLDIATDKVDSEVPSSIEGTISEILYSVNDVVPVGSVIAKIQTSASEVVAVPTVSVAPPQFVPEPQVIPEPVIIAPQPYYEPTAHKQEVEPSVTHVEDLPYTPQNVNVPKSSGNNRFFSPLVLNIANSEGLSLSELERISGTGADGRVSKKDVIQYVADKKSGKQPAFTATQPQVVYLPQPAPEPQIVYMPEAPAYVAPQPEYTALRVIEEPAAEAVKAAFVAPRTEPILMSEPVVVTESVTKEMEPVTKEVEPVTKEVEPITKEVEPVTKEVEPVTKEVEPVTKEVEPVIKEVEPQIEQTVATSTQQTTVKPVSQAVFMPTPAYAENISLTTLAEGGSGKYANPISALPTGNTEIIEMGRMRKLIAKHMVNSVQTSPHVTSFGEADVTNMVLWRNRVKNEFERREGTKITFTPIFIECLVKVMQQYPLINSSIDGDNIVLKKDFNIGMATALPTGNLIVPVIKSAEKLNIVGLSFAVNNLANAARNNQLKPDDTSGGTFTFTNVGTFGSLMGTPIINQPQVAILAVGVIKKRPVVIESPDGDTIGIRHMMYLSLSYDHRVIDGSIGASFLSAVAKEFEQWDVNRTWYQYT